MRKYFYSLDGKHQSGPVGKDELKAAGITRTTKVWTEGMPSWTEAGEVEDLADIFALMPPPLNPPPLNSTEQETPPPLTDPEPPKAGVTDKIGNMTWANLTGKKVPADLPTETWKKYIAISIGSIILGLVVLRFLTPLLASIFKYRVDTVALILGGVI